MLYPLFAMVVWTFGVMFLTALLRITAVRKGEVSARYFKVMAGEAPDYILKTGRHFSNLFETPLLFYTAGVLAIVLQIDSAFLILTAWLYVALRVVHAYIHITYNNVIHRLIVFLLGNFCILGMWLVIVTHS